MKYAIVAVQMKTALPKTKMSEFISEERDYIQGKAE